LRLTNQQKIYVAGHQRMVDSAIGRAVKRLGQTNLMMRTRRELDLCDQVREMVAVDLADARKSALLSPTDTKWQ